MNLVVHELKANSGVGSVYWAATVRSTSPVVDAAMRPHIIRYGSPTGSLYLEVQKASDGTVYGTSETVAISSIPSGNYWHGWIKFSLNCILGPSAVVNVYLKSSGGYSFSESAYIGWCNDYDMRRYTASYTPVGALDAPMDIEAHEYKLVTKGTYP